MDKIKWGIVGPGHIASAFISDLALVTENINTVDVVMSNDWEEAEEFAKTNGIPFYYSNINEMLHDCLLDAVYIASPHSAHYKESLVCLQNGVPVLCEKPLALNLQQAEEMVEMARAHHTFLLEGMWIRFLPSIQMVMELLEQGVIGNINSIRANMSYRAPQDEQNRFYNPDLGGGSLLDLGIYPVYLSLLILGNPLKIKVAARLSAENIDENCAIIFEYADGVYALLESSIIKNTGNEASIYGDKGVITLLKQWDEKPENIVVSLYNGTTHQYPCEWDGRGFQYEIAEVIHCLSSNKIESEKHTHADSLKLMETLDTIREEANIIYPSYE